MKKVLLALALSALFVSCKKDFILHSEEEEEEVQEFQSDESIGGDSGGPFCGEGYHVHTSRTWGPKCFKNPCTLKF